MLTPSKQVGMMLSAAGIVMMLPRAANALEVTDSDVSAGGTSGAGGRDASAAQRVTRAARDGVPPCVLH